MWHVCEHLKTYIWIKECNRILKKGGKIIIGTPDWKKYYKIFYYTYTHCTPYTKPLIEALAKRNNFKVIDNRTFANAPILWKYSLLAFNMIFPFKPQFIISILEKN